MLGEISKSEDEENYDGVNEREVDDRVFENLLRDRIARTGI